MPKISFVFILVIFVSFNAAAQTSSDDELAYQYYQQGNYEKAAELFGHLFGQTNNNSYFELYHSSLLKNKQYDQAEQLCKKLIKQWPNQFNYPIALAKTYQEAGKTKEAQKLFESTIEKYTRDEQSTRELANLLYGVAAYDLVIKTFLQGRKHLKNEQAFGFELVSLYRVKKEKTALVDEYLNLLPQNPMWLNQAEMVLANLFDNPNDYRYLQTELLKKVQRNPDVEVLNSLLIWQYIQQKEYEQALRQVLAKDRRTQNGLSEIFETAEIFMQNSAFSTAQKAYEYIVAKGPESEGYIQAKVQLINCQFEQAMISSTAVSTLTVLANEFETLLKQYGINGQTLFAVRKLAYLQAYLLKTPNKAEQTLEKTLNVPMIPSQEIANLKIDLGDIYLLNNQPWEAILMYEQVAKQFENSAIGNEARFRSAQLSFYQGNFQYAKSQADVLKAASSQLMANDALKLSLLINDNLTTKDDSLALTLYAQAALLQKGLKLTAAQAKLDSIVILYPKNSLADDISMAKVKIYLGQKSYLDAKNQLQKLIENHPSSMWMDEALFTLANLLEKQLNQAEEAEKYYHRLITEYTDSLLIDEARKRFRILRGDKLSL